MNLPRDRRTWVLVALLVAAGCGRDAAPPRVPAARPAPTSPFRLPAIGADGAPPAVATIVVPLLPSAMDGTATDLDADDLPETWEPPEPESDAAAVAAAWPDVEALLDGLDVEHRVDDGVVTFSGADADVAGRVLAAAHAALSRTVRVQVVAVRTTPGDRAPTADDVLAAHGPDVVARIDRELHDGAACVADLRETQVFPADVDVEDDMVVARAVAFDVGSFLAVSPARLDTDRTVLRIAFHESRVVSERVVAGDDVSRVTPALAVSALLLSAPAASGRADVVLVEGAGAKTTVGDTAAGHAGFAVAWRVTPVDDPAAPSGTRAFSVHADRPPFVCEAPPRVGIVDLARDQPTSDSLPDAVVPSLAPSATAELRVVAAEPGIVVVSGAEDALARFDAALTQRTATAFPAARFREGATSIPFVRIGDVVVIDGRLDAVIATPESSSAMSNAAAATRTSWTFTGRSVRITPEPGGARVIVSSAPAPEIVAAPREWPRAAWGAGPAVRDVVDAATVRSADVTTHLEFGASSGGLEVLAW